MTLFGCERFSCFAEQQPKKFQSTETTYEPRFSKSFDVIIVHMIHYVTVVDGFVTRVHADKRAEPGTFNGVVKKNVFRAAKHRCAADQGRITGPGGRESLDCRACP